MWVSYNFHQHTELHKSQNKHVCNCSLERNTTLQAVKVRLRRGEETQGLVNLENTWVAFQLVCYPYCIQILRYFHSKISIPKGEYFQWVLGLILPTTPCTMRGRVCDSLLQYLYALKMNRNGRPNLRKKKRNNAQTYKLSNNIYFGSC